MARDFSGGTGPSGCGQGSPGLMDGWMDENTE